jgi:hypothetical protein
LVIFFTISLLSSIVIFKYVMGLSVASVKIVRWFKDGSSSGASFLSSFWGRLSIFCNVLTFSLSFGEVVFLLRSFGGACGTASSLGEGLLGGIGSLSSMVALRCFVAGKGTSAPTACVKRHLSPFLQRFFKKNLQGVLLTRWCGTNCCCDLRCAKRYCGTGGGELYLLLFDASSGLGDLKLQGIAV